MEISKSMQNLKLVWDSMFNEQVFQNISDDDPFLAISLLIVALQNQFQVLKTKRLNISSNATPVQTQPLTHCTDPLNENILLTDTPLTGLSDNQNESKDCINTTSFTQTKGSPILKFKWRARRKKSGKRLFKKTPNSDESTLLYSPSPVQLTKKSKSHSDAELLAAVDKKGKKAKEKVNEFNDSELLSIFAEDMSVQDFNEKKNLSETFFQVPSPVKPNTSLEEIDFPIPDLSLTYFPGVSQKRDKLSNSALIRTSSSKIEDGVVLAQDTDDDDFLPPRKKTPPKLKKFVYKRDAVRKKDERAKLPGQVCKECERYYNALGTMDERRKQELLNKCSRHRDYEPLINNTPKGFWNIQFTPTQERKT